MKTGSLLVSRRPVLERLLLGLAGAAAALAAADKKPAPPGYAVIGGTVFREPGFSLPGAEIVLEPEAPAKQKRQKAVSDARGEFAFRVPPIAAKYRVTVTARGFRSDSKSAVTQGGEERIDVTFSLAAESK
jgi:hypothetical protein